MCDLGRGGDTHPYVPPPLDRREAGPDRRATRNTGTKRGTGGALVSPPSSPSQFSTSDGVGTYLRLTAGAEEERGEQSHRGEQTRLTTAARRNSSQRPDEAYTPSFLPTHYHPNDRRASGVGAQDLDGNEK